LQLQVSQPVKEKRKLRKLRKDTLKDEEKKLFPEVCVLVVHLTSAHVGSNYSLKVCVTFTTDLAFQLKIG